MTCIMVAVRLTSSRKRHQVYAGTRAAVVVHITRSAGFGRSIAGLQEEIVPIDAVGKGVEHFLVIEKQHVDAAGHRLDLVPAGHSGKLGVDPPGAFEGRVVVPSRIDDVALQPLVDVGGDELRRLEVRAPRIGVGNDVAELSSSRDVIGGVPASPLKSGPAL
jgi:hypothetical protein